MNTLQISKQNHQLEALLPIVGYHKLPVRFFVISILFFMYGLTATIISFNENLGLNQTLIPYLLIVFTLLTIIGLILSIVLMFSEVKVIMNHNEFIMERSFWGIQKSYITDISNISPICLEEVTFKALLTTIKLIIIYDIGHKHYLGAWLSEEDRNELYMEMIRFLSQFQHETIQYSSSD